MKHNCRFLKSDKTAAFKMRKNRRFGEEDKMPLSKYSEMTCLDISHSCKEEKIRKKIYEAKVQNFSCGDISVSSIFQ